MNWNSIEIGFIVDFCAKFKIGLVINDGMVIRGENELFSKEEEN